VAGSGGSAWSDGCRRGCERLVGGLDVPAGAWLAGERSRLISWCWAASRDIAEVLNCSRLLIVASLRVMRLLRSSISSSAGGSGISWVWRFLVEIPVVTAARILSSGAGSCVESARRCLLDGKGVMSSLPPGVVLRAGGSRGGTDTLLGAAVLFWVTPRWESSLVRWLGSGHGAGVGCSAAASMAARTRRIGRVRWSVGCVRACGCVRGSRGRWCWRPRRPRRPVMGVVGCL